MCDCGNTDAGKYFARIGGQFGDLATSKAMRFADYGKGKIKAWTGFGDYQIRTNSLINSSGGLNLGMATSGRSTFIRWKEYIGDVYTHPTTVGAFNATTYVVNPANLQTFPWLSSLANQYEQYKPRGVIFEFRSTATDTTTNASLGSVIITSEYDILDQAYSSKADMLNSAYSSEGKMTDSILHGIECDPEELSRKVFYTRNAGAQTTFTTADRDYDVCRTTIATQGGGLSAGQSVGSLYVHYEFEFLKEQVYGGINALDQIFCGFANTLQPAAPQTQAFGFQRKVGIDMGLTFANDGIIFPQYWAGATIKLTFIYSQTTAFTIGLPGNAVYQGCAKAQVNPAVSTGGGGWTGYYAPFQGTLTATTAVTMAVAYVKLNQPLTIPATMNWPATSTWGIIPTSIGTGMILDLIVEVVNRDFNVTTT